MEGYYVGWISSIDKEKGYVKVTIPQYDNLVSEWLPLLSFEYSMPEAGTQVAILIDKYNKGVCLGSIYSNNQKPETTEGYYKNLNGIKITNVDDEFKVYFNSTNYISYKDGTLNIRADNVNIIRNSED